ncbi:endonuclease/exonuclease/phosphatase family protein [Streptomyces sp. NPDC001635]
MWCRGRIIATCAVACTLVILLHGMIPNSFGNLGSLVESFLPWASVSIPLLLVLALIRRSALALITVLLPAFAYLSLFGGTLVDKRGDGGNLTVVTHNVNDRNPDPTGTARSLASSGADVIALQKLTAVTTPIYEKALDSTYTHHSVQGTVGLWSKYPLNSTRPIAIMPWTRALRSTVDTPHGPVAVFVAHLPSVRVHLSTGFAASERDKSARLLADALREDPVNRTILVGDFNGTADDSALRSVTAGMRSTQQTAGDGFGLTWPASFPLVRIDQIFVKGVKPVSSWTLPATGSDHLPVAASVEI